MCVCIYVCVCVCNNMIESLQSATLVEHKMGNEKSTFIDMLP